MLRRVAADSQLTPEMCLKRALHLFDELSKRGKGDLKELLDARTARSECARDWWGKQSVEFKKAHVMNANRARWRGTEPVEESELS